MITFPGAKINIGLRVTEKRDDGFHDIDTVFYPIGINDVLEIIAWDKEEISFSSTGISIPGNKNICVKAVELLKNKFPDRFKNSGVAIHLHKIISIGAGLGGGSSDAAFALKMLDKLFKLNLDDKTIHASALQLGSDCPFFLEGKPVYAKGRGNEFEAVSLNLSKYFLTLVYPEVHVSTAWAYSEIIPSQPKISSKELIKLPIEKWKNEIFNDFEIPVFKKFPAINSIKEKLYSEGAIYASMSGSGSACYGIFSSKKDLSAKFSAYKIWSGNM